MLRQQVKLQIHPRPRHDRLQARDFVGVGDDPEDKAVLVQLGDGDADVVDADRAFVNHEMGEFAGKGHGEAVILTDSVVGDDFGAGVDVALDEVSAEPVSDAEGALEIDGITGL